MEEEVVYTDWIGKLVWFPRYKALLHTYFDDSEKATNDQFIEHIRHMAEIVRKYRPLGLIEDYASIKFVTSPEVQRQIVMFMKPLLAEVQLKRYAKLIKPGDMISQLLSEQIVDEARRLSSYVIPDKVFIKLQDALDWIETALE